MTFFDHHSLKNLGRRLRQPLDKQAAQDDHDRRAGARTGREGGADLVACPALAPMGSGHRYALLVKRT
jgi:hypothetical protein